MGAVRPSGEAARETELLRDVGRGPAGSDERPGDRRT